MPKNRGAPHLRRSLRRRSPEAPQESISRQVEHQHFGARAALDHDLTAVALQRVAPRQFVAVDDDAAARDVDVTLA